MKLSIKLELQDNDGKAIVMGGNTLPDPTERDVRQELFVLGERMLVFMAEFKAAQKVAS